MGMQRHSFFVLKGESCASVVGAQTDINIILGAEEVDKMTKM